MKTKPNIQKLHSVTILFALVVVFAFTSNCLAAVPATITIYNDTSSTIGNIGCQNMMASMSSSGSSPVSHGSQSNLATTGLPCAPGGYCSVTLDSEPYGGYYVFYSVSLGVSTAGNGYIAPTFTTPWLPAGTAQTIGVNGPAPCVTNLSWTVTDNSQYGSTYGVVDINTAPTGGYRQYYSGTFVRPGASAILTLNNVFCTDIGNYAIATIGEDTYHTSSGGTNETFVNQNDWNGTTNLAPFVSTADQNNNGTVYNAAPGNGTTNILFSAAAGTNAAISQQEGDSALYDAVTKGAQQNHSDLQSLLIVGTNSLSLANQQLISMSNLLYGIQSGTNAAGNDFSQLTNVSKEVTLRGLTNLVNQQYQFQTNRQGNYDWASNALSDAFASTMSQISTATNGVQNSISSTFSSAIPVTEIASDLSQGGGVDFGIITLGSGINFVLGASALDEALPSLSAGHPYFKFAIILLLVICNYKVLVVGMRTTLLVPQARSSGTAIAGFNINAASAIVMAGSIVALAGAIPTICSSGVLSALADISWGNPFSSAAGAIGEGYTFCNHYFPVGLSIVAVLNHVGFRVFSNGIEMVGLACVKFLVGL